MSDDADAAGDSGAGAARSGTKADAKLALFGGLLAATGAAVVCYAILRFVWRQVGR